MLLYDVFLTVTDFGGLGCCMPQVMPGNQEDFAADSYLIALVKSFGGAPPALSFPPPPPGARA